MSQPDPPPMRLASTVLLLRDGAQGAEVFMVTRSAGSSFLGGAVVFPGGSVDAADEAWARARMDLDDAHLRLAAIRELFEETGFLLVREAGDRAVIDARRAEGLIARWRKAVHGNEVSMARMLEAEGLEPALERLVFFARWVTPPGPHKRFDTHFFAAVAPAEQSGLHDGAELVASRWATADQLLTEAAAGTLRVVFPTRMNLMLVKGAATAAGALAGLRGRPTEPIHAQHTPAPGGGSIGRIPAAAGYPVSEDWEAIPTLEPRA